MSLSLTSSTKNASHQNSQPRWILIDAKGKTLGRLSTQIANALRGKRKVNYTPNVRTMGDHVVVINCAKIGLTGNKKTQKMYHTYSGYPGGIKSVTMGFRLQNRPTELVRDSVKLMLPKNKLQKYALTRLHLYADDKHPHTSIGQEPTK